MSQIITIDDLETYMAGQTVDPGLAQQVVDGMNAYVESLTGRCFGEVKTVTERPNWTSTLWFRHMDVTEIVSVKMGWPGQTQTTMGATGYYLNPMGRLTMFSSANGGLSRLSRDYIEVVYKHGSLEVPEDLKFAVLGLAAGLYSWAGNSGQDVDEAQVGSYRLQYRNGRGGTGEADPANKPADANWSIIQSYRLRRL